MSVTATGDQQSPIHNTIGRAIVDACVRAGKEGRKFRVIIMIPAIPGFAGDLRQDAAAGTRAIMDYQYKSINRGEHSIMGQIAAQGVNPKGDILVPFFRKFELTISDHVFVFNLRAYDRINKTTELVAQEERSGVKYQDVQRAEAEEIMSEGVHPKIGNAGDKKEKDTQGDEVKESLMEKLRRFEAQRNPSKSEDKTGSANSIAKTAMLNGGKASEQPWEGDPESEKENYVQEELYIHSKLLIVDDRTVICGSSNINDRVCSPLLPLRTPSERRKRKKQKLKSTFSLN